MKPLMLILLSLLLVLPVLGQEKTYVIKEYELTEAQKAKLNTQEKMQAVNSWVGFGKEVGTAMKEGLSALNEETNKFSESPAGKFTMFIIAYKVLGKDIARYAIGVPLWIVGTIFLLFIIYRNCVLRRVLIKTDGKWWGAAKEYQVVNLNSSDLDARRWGHAVVFLFFNLLMAIITLVSFPG